MQTGTTLPLTGGREGHGGADRPEGQKDAPAFTKTSWDDATLATDYDDVLDVNHFQLALTILLKYFKVYFVDSPFKISQVVFYH